MQDQTITLLQHEINILIDAIKAGHSIKGSLSSNYLENVTEIIQTLKAN